ncbi:MAG: cyclic-di-AMP receptor, partial [Clostridia bacterium]|nr:cyclic-di-AMP receptor [Clostridia bacterium]
MSMKLIIAIVHSDDAQAVITEISRAGYSATKLSTSGGFMRAGN